ncbi:MAG: aminoacyl-tRNA hydrolase [Acholeplasmataceae bacterium]|jgi:PTH1 family peptidyl-tRNA hydrolase|nr:aminoacyl-tRNA hydrolase [Acholeplasmataceae bacterium]
MKVIVGLGNPGQKYQKTRHNIGFMVIDTYLEKCGEKAKLDVKFNAEVAIINQLGKKTIFVKPSTYMNLSGEAIAKILKYYDVDIEDLLIFVDDINLQTGKLRLREIGGHGGHNGLKNIIGLLHTESFKRVRIGIDNNPVMALDQYVLGQFTEDQLITLQLPIKQSVEIIDLFIEDKPFKDIMTKYNTQT